MFRWIKWLFGKEESTRFTEASNGMNVETDNPIMAEVVSKAFETGKMVTYSNGKLEVHGDTDEKNDS